MFRRLLAAVRGLLASLPLATQHTAPRPTLGHAARPTAHEATAPAHDHHSEIDAGGFGRARPPRSPVALPGLPWRAWADVPYPSAIAAVAAGLTQWAAAHHTTHNAPTPQRLLTAGLPHDATRDPWTAELVACTAALVAQGHASDAQRPTLGHLRAVALRWPFPLDGAARETRTSGLLFLANLAGLALGLLRLRTPPAAGGVAGPGLLAAALLLHRLHLAVRSAAPGPHAGRTRR